MNKELFLKIFPSVFIFFVSVLMFILRKIILLPKNRNSKILKVLDKYLLKFVVICEKYVGSGSGGFKKELVVDMIVNKFNNLGIKLNDNELNIVYNQIDAIVNDINEFKEVTNE